MHLLDRLRDSYASYTARYEQFHERFDNWVDDNLTLDKLRSASGKAMHNIFRKDVITPAHFSGLRTAAATGFSALGGAVGALGKGWAGLQEKADQVYQDVSRPVGLGGLGLLHSLSGKLETSKYKREQNKLLKDSAAIASQLRELARVRPGFTFEEQITPDSRTGYNKVVFTTNLPNSSNPDAPSTITLSDKGIETWGLGAAMGSKTAKQVKGLLDGFKPDPFGPPHYGTTHYEPVLDPTSPESSPEAPAAAEQPEWEKHVVAPKAPADPARYNLGQMIVSETHHSISEKLEQLQEAHPGLKFSSHIIPDEHHGTQRVVITTNIPSTGSQTQGSDTLKIILTPELGETGKLRIAGLGRSGDTTKELENDQALQFISRVAGVHFPAPAVPATAAASLTPEATKTETTQPEATATTAAEPAQVPLAEGILVTMQQVPAGIEVATYRVTVTAKDDAGNAPEATAAAPTGPALSFEEKARNHFELMSKVNPGFSYRPIPLNDGLMVLTNIPAGNDAGHMRFVITPELTAQGKVMLNDSTSQNEQLLPCSAALNRLSELSIERLPVTEPEYADGRKVPVLRVVHCPT